MIAYLCELHREGHVNPLLNFLGRLREGIGDGLPQCLLAAREWNSIDLAILNQNHQPVILFEMKVDDHERETWKRIGGERRSGWSTTLDAVRFPDCSAYFYVTLGMGEFWRRPHEPRFTWVRSRDLLGAICAIDAPDQALRDWAQAVRNEVDLQKRVLV